jgi:hypothetical protein
MGPDGNNIDLLYAMGPKSIFLGTRDADTTKKLTSYSLFNFTKDIYSRLPREIRDIIYHYVFTEQDVASICRSISISLNNLPFQRNEQTGVAESRLPVYPHPSLSYKPFAYEILDTMY